MYKLPPYPRQGTTKQQINWIQNIDSNSLLHREKYGEIFVETAKTFKDIQSYFKKIDLDKLEHIIRIRHLNLSKNMGSIAYHIRQMCKDGLLSAQNPDVILDQCYEKFRVNLQSIMIKLKPYLQSIQLDAPTAANTRQIEKRLEDILSQAEEKHQQLDQIVEGSTKVASKTSIAFATGHFDEEAKSHKKNAHWLLKASGAIGMVLLGTAIYFSNKPPADLTLLNWNHYIPRFSILSLLVFFEIILIGIYRAERHNAVINKHRANALNTFEAMTAATLTQDVKDAVTLTAAEAIYAPQDTGYSKKGSITSHKAADTLAALASARK